MARKPPRDRDAQPSNRDRDSDRPDGHTAYSDRCRHCNRPVHPNRDSDRCERCSRTEQHPPTTAQLRRLLNPDRDSPRPVPHTEDDPVDPAEAARERRNNRWQPADF